MTLKQVKKLLLSKSQKYAIRTGSSGVYGWCKANRVNMAHVFSFLNDKCLPQSDLLEALGLEWRVERKSRQRR